MVATVVIAHAKQQFDAVVLDEEAAGHVSVKFGALRGPDGSWLGMDSER